MLELVALSSAGSAIAAKSRAGARRECVASASARATTASDTSRRECMCKVQHLAASTGVPVRVVPVGSRQPPRHRRHNSHCARRERLWTLAHLLASFAWTCCGSQRAHTSVFWHTAICMLVVTYIAQFLSKIISMWMQRFYLFCTKTSEMLLFAHWLTRVLFTFGKTSWGTDHFCFVEVRKWNNR